MESLILVQWAHQLIAPVAADYALVHLVESEDISLPLTNVYEKVEAPCQTVWFVPRGRDTEGFLEAWGPRTTSVTPLSGYTPFDRPVFLDEIRTVGADLMEIFTELKSERPKPYYFPWGDHSSGVKPAQKYLTKVPANAVAFLQRMRPDSDWEGMGAESILLPWASITSTLKRRRYAGCCADPDVRHAVQLQAVARAGAHY